MQSELALPLISRGETLGVLSLQNEATEGFPPETIAAMQTLASRLATAIHNARLFATVDQQLEQLATLYHISLQVGSHLNVNLQINNHHLDFNELLDNLAQLSTQLTKTDGSIVRLIDIDQKIPNTLGVASHFPLNPTIKQDDEFVNSLSSEVLTVKQPILANNWDHHPLSEKYIARSASTEKILSLIIVPIILRNQPIGTMEVQSFTQTEAFDENDLHILSLLASQAAVAIENTHLFHQAENNARFLKTVMGYIPDPIFIKDKNHTWLEMNQANADVIGQAYDDLIGKTDRDFFSETLAEEFYRRDDQVFAEQKPLTFEDVTTWADGQQHTAYTRLVPIPDAGGKEPTYLLGITHDITERKRQEAEREEILAETAALYNGSQAIMNAVSEQEIFEALFEQFRRQNPSEMSAYYFDTVQNEAIWGTLTAAWHNKNEPSYISDSKFYLPDHPQARLLMTETPLFIENIATDPQLSAEERKSFTPTGACSVAILPIIARAHHLGTILIHFTEPYTFPEKSRRFWLALVDQARVALSNRHLLQEVTHRIVQIETAADVAQVATSILSLDELLNSAVYLIRDRFDLYYVGLYLLDETEQFANLHAGTGEAGQRQRQIAVDEETIIGWSISQRKARIALDIGENAIDLYDPTLPDTRSQMVLPLVHGTQAIGALSLRSVEPAAFTQEDTTFLRTLADQLATAIENALLFKQAQEQINERKHTEEALRLQKTLLESQGEASPAGIMVVSNQSEVLSFNQQFIDLWGISADILESRSADVVLKAILDYLVDSETFLDKVRDFHQNDIEIDESEMIFKDGRILSQYTAPVKNVDGIHYGRIWYYTDITEQKQNEQAILRKNEELAIINRITTSIRSTLSMESVLDIVTQEMVDALQVRNCGIALLNPDRTALTVVADHSSSSDEPDGKGLIIPLENNPSTTKVIDTAETLIIYQAQTDPLTEPIHDILKARRTESLLISPLKVRDVVIGTLALDTTDPSRKFTDQEKHLIETIVSQIAGFVENAQLFEQTEQALTDQQKAEEALRESEERFKRLSNASTEGIAITNKGVLIDANQRVAEMHGYASPADMIGKPALEVVASEHQDMVRDNIQSGYEETYEYLAVRKDGTTFPVEVQGRPIPYKGEMYRVTSLRDITYRVEAEAALRASEEKYRTVLDSIEDAYYEVDLAGNFTFFNDALTDLLGYPTEQLLGMNNRDYADPENAEKLYRGFNRVYQGEETFTHVHWQGIRQDGTKRYVETSVSLRTDASNQPVGFRGLSRDVTERWQVEQALRENEALLAEAQRIGNFGAWTWDVTDDTVTWTDSLFDIFNIPKETPLNFETYQSMIHPDEREKAVEIILSAMQSDATSYTFEHRLSGRSEDEPIYIYVFGRILRNEQGEPAKLIGVAQDITDRKQAE
ncbi:MAG: PAS domain S-box protein [Chloroflexota bacterium]